MREYGKEECVALLRESADAHYRRTELLVIGSSAAGFLLVFGLLAFLDGLEWWLLILLYLLGFVPFMLYDVLLLRKLYRRWDRYEYLPGRVDKEIATFDYRRDATALQVVAYRPDGSGIVANTRNIFRQKSVFLDGWPLASEYSNCEVLIAYDKATERAIILKRIYKKRT